MTRAIARGVATMFQQRRLAMILWAWSLVVGVAGAAPAVRWFRQAWGLRPEADTMLFHFDLPTFVELSHYDVSPTWGMVMAAAGGAVMLAFVGGAFITAGVIHLLLDRDDAERTRTLWSRFGRGGGQAFWRSLTVSVINAIALGVGAALTYWAGRALLHTLAEWPSEAAAWTAMLGPWIPVAVVVAVLSATTDYARLRVVADPVCGAFRAWFGALSFTLRHPLSTTVIWSAFAGMTLVVLIASFAWSINVPTHTMAWLVVLVLVQQGVMLARAMVRVGALGAQAAYADAKGFVLPELPTAVVELLPQEPPPDGDPVDLLDAR